SEQGYRCELGAQRFVGLWGRPFGAAAGLLPGASVTLCFRPPASPLDTPPGRAPRRAKAGRWRLAIWDCGVSPFGLEIGHLIVGSSELFRESDPRQEGGRSVMLGGLSNPILARWAHDGAVRPQDTALRHMACDP